MTVLTTNDPTSDALLLSPESLLQLQRPQATGGDRNRRLSGRTDSPLQPLSLVSNGRLALSTRTRCDLLSDACRSNELKAQGATAIAGVLHELHALTLLDLRCAFGLLLHSRPLYIFVHVIRNLKLAWVVCVRRHIQAESLRLTISARAQIELTSLNRCKMTSLSCRYAKEIRGHNRI